MTGTIECPVCRGTYKTERGLAAHVARFHGGTQPEKPMDAVVSEVDGYFKQWADGQKLAREKLGEAPVPRPVPVQRPEPGLGRDFPGEQFERLFGESATAPRQTMVRPSDIRTARERRTRTVEYDAKVRGRLGRYSSYKKKQSRSMFVAAVVAIILTVPCAYYMTTSGIFGGVEPYIVTPDVPASFDLVESIQVLDGDNGTDITGQVTTFSLVVATDVVDFETYSTVVQTANVSLVLAELREYAYTPASFRVLLSIVFASGYGSRWAELTPAKTIVILCERL